MTFTVFSVYSVFVVGRLTNANVLGLTIGWTLFGGLWRLSNSILAVKQQLRLRYKDCESGNFEQTRFDK